VGTERGREDLRKFVVRDSKDLSKGGRVSTCNRRKKVKSHSAFINRKMKGKERRRKGSKENRDDQKKKSNYLPAEEGHIGKETYHRPKRDGGMLRTEITENGFSKKKHLEKDRTH